MIEPMPMPAESASVWNADSGAIPPFPRLPKEGSREMTLWAINRIDARIDRLGRLGLRPHPSMLAYRAELVAQIAGGGPYSVAVRSAYF